MVLLVVDTQKLITTLDLYNFNAFEDAVKTLIAAARENNVEVVYVRKHGNMRKENNHAVIPVRKNLFTDGEGIRKDQEGRRRNIRYAAVTNGRECIKNTP